MKRLCIIEPLVTTYDHKLYIQLLDYFQVDVIHSPVAPTDSYGDVSTTSDRRLRFLEVPILRPFGNRLGMFQRGLAKYLISQRPDNVIIFANCRYLSFWTVLVLCRLLRIPAHARGHGLYKRPNANLLSRSAYAILLKLVESYICYTPTVKASLLRHGFPVAKLRVAENSLVNEHCVRPTEKDGSERGILFIGRLRKGCNVTALLKVAMRLIEVDGMQLEIHVVGDGEEKPLIESLWGAKRWLHLHGQVYDQKYIETIARKCFVGCYPGNTGLSVIHMMSLSLPPVLHDEITKQGPEASYVEHRSNGLFFKHENADESLYDAIRYMAQSSRAVKSMQERAFATYQRLTTPSQATRLAAIIDGASASAFTLSGQ